jgi:enoyl-CoA hydratase/carnithine racemase
MIQFEIKEGVGKITLNRADKYHAFGRAIRHGR